MGFCFGNKNAYGIIDVMKKMRSGFTIVEVALFLAITGLLFMGIAGGVQTSLFQQRYNDSVQSFAEFLRSVYSQVTNVEGSSINGGRSDRAIYGKLVTFGETKDLSGEDNSDGAVFSYTVVGNAGDDIGTGGNVLSSLKALEINIRDESGLVGIVESYIPRWGAKIEDISGSKFDGALLIVRHPSSGTVYTYIYEGEVSNIINSDGLMNGWEANFKLEQADFCVDPDGVSGGVRRDVRITQGARNASGVEVMPADIDNVCNGEG